MKVHITEGAKYEPGSQPPEGYLQWHEWAGYQHRAGLRQRWCEGCGKWRFPQEQCCSGKRRLTKRELSALEKRMANVVWVREQE